MEQPPVTLAHRQLALLEALLRVPAGNLHATLSHVSDLIAAATGADKIDAFLYDPARDSLVAVGTSSQPLSHLQRSLGLDVLQLSNGGRAVHVYRSGETYVHGQVDADAEELRGIREALGVRSEIGVPLAVGGERRGMLLLASLKPGFFSADDVRFVESVAHWVGIVAHRAELAEELGRAALEQGRRAAGEELVTVLAHDLRNLLTPLGTRLELLRMRARRDGRADDVRDVEAARRAVDRLGGLVSDILDVARLDQGVFELEPEPVDLGALVQETVALLATPEHAILLRAHEGAPLIVSADSARLRQCLENVVANAVQKSPAKAAVTVFVSRDDKRARVEVVDQGPGIPADLLPHVFERFVSGSRREGGLGLGLYLAKRIAAAHGGDLSVQSLPGKGARFALTLPLAAESGAAPQAAP